MRISDQTACQDAVDTSLPHLKRAREPGRCEAGSWMGFGLARAREVLLNDASLSADEWASVWRARVRCFGFGRTERPRRLGPADELVVGGLEDRVGDDNSGDSSRGTVKVRRRREMNREL
jgi:hypothetical protein